MATYIVTGCAGFIASRVSQLLLEQGNTVIGIDNLNDSTDVRLKQWRLQQYQHHPQFVFHHLDICDSTAVSAVIPPHADAMINLAARAGVRQSVANPWIYIDTNVTGTLTLLELCRQKGITKFVLASTSSLYGSHNEVPFHETADTNRPPSPYAASKKGAEALCATYHDLYAIDVSILRYFTVYGPAGRPDMSPLRFVQWIAEGRPVTVYGDGTQSRDFTYVDDIARGTIAALAPLGYNVINLGSDKPVALIDVIHLIEKLLDTTAHLVFEPPHPADMHKTWAVIERAQQLLGWHAQVPLAEGLERLVAWYRTNREWAKDIDTR